MRVLITGATGFIGQPLCARLRQQGHDILALSRSPKRASSVLGSEVDVISSLQDIPGDAQIDAIINLAGAPIFSRPWTRKRKQVLQQSRVQTTEDLVALVNRLKHKPGVMISGSAVGFYGDAGAAELTESSSAVKRDFTYLLCDAWEQSARKVAQQGVRLSILRTGIVLGKHGGMMAPLLKLYRAGLGARLGSGTQWFSWIHIDDMVRIILYCLDKQDASGVYNAVAPHPVTSGVFHETLARVCHRPALLRIPEFAIRLLLQEMAALVVGGQRVLPARLQEQGFCFSYPELEPALTDLLD